MSDDHSSQKIDFDERGQLRFINQDSPELEFIAVDLAKENKRVVKVNIKNPNGTLDEGILLPRKLSNKAMEASSSLALSGTMSMQPGTVSGREGAPSTGAQQLRPRQKQQQVHPQKKPRNVLQEMRDRYPEYFQPRPVPSLNIREAIDPYSFSVRNQFINAARTDPTIAPALRKRKNAFFRNGFTLELETKDQRSLTTNKVMTDEELDTFNVAIYQRYHTVLRRLETWATSSPIELLENMNKSYYSAVVQGRYLTQFFPPLSFLEPNVLPLFLTTLSTEELHNVVIDKFTKHIVACRIASIDNDKFILLPDEFIYGYINDDTMTKYETLYGRSDLEPVIQASRTNKFIVAEAYPKAVVATYMPKVVGLMPVSGSPEEKEAILKSRAASLSDPELNVLLLEASEHSKLEALPQTVNQDMIRDVRRDIDEIMIGAVGSTKAQISRTEGLTRDNATIQEIENERNVIGPDEKLHAKFFESQLLNPLFAHLCGVPEEHLDVKVVIRRIPDKEDILEKYNKAGDKKEGGDAPAGPEGRQENLEEEKKEDIAAGALQQQDAQSALGASGTAEANGDYISWFVHLPKKHQIRWRQYDPIQAKLNDLGDNMMTKDPFEKHKDDDDKKWAEFINGLLDKLTDLAANPKPKKTTDTPDSKAALKPLKSEEEDSKQ